MKKSKAIFLALIVMALWGSLFPCVKIGYKFLQINTAFVPDILMFAALRFAICGAAVFAYCLLRQKKMGRPSRSAVLPILLIGLFATVLHYAFYYIGLSTTDSSKTALLKQSAALIYVCFSFLFIKDDSHAE